MEQIRKHLFVERSDSVDRQLWHGQPRGQAGDRGEWHGGGKQCRKKDGFRSKPLSRVRSPSPEMTG